MLSHNDPFPDMQRRITGQIGALAKALPHCALAQIVQSIDDIRCLARDHGFAAVETLASRLESAVGSGGQRAAILTYLDAMSDAASAPGPLPAAAQEAWLASVAMRLGH
ncbi:hypothetical protein CDQ91_09195 [Sphingopyxis witflariensis]|uniref:Uncharacterized protein n=2 Tax=Sphingopyxis witflariensis TaxID=173675 RepID=A0A246JY70_9SPHN|nr:hypothetical protein CDQ91_09195 [Sphingopyxis witflariensis]